MSIQSIENFIKFHLILLEDSSHCKGHINVTTISIVVNMKTIACSLSIPLHSRRKVCRANPNSNKKKRMRKGKTIFEILFIHCAPYTMLNDNGQVSVNLMLNLDNDNKNKGDCSCVYLCLCTVYDVRCTNHIHSTPSWTVIVFIFIRFGHCFRTVCGGFDNRCIKIATEKNPP